MTVADLPGPKGEPFFGNIRQFVKNPIRFFEMCLREYGDMTYINYAGTNGVLVTHPEMVQEVLVTRHKSLIKGKGTKRLSMFLGDSILVTEGDHHRRLRRLSQPSFSKQNLLSYGHHIGEEVTRGANVLHNGQSFDMNSLMMEVTLRIVCRALMGSDVSQAVDKVGHGLDHALALWQTGFNPITRVINMLPTKKRRMFEKSKHEVDQVIAKMIADAQAAEGAGDTLLQSLVSARDDDNSKLNNMELRNEVMTMIMAGHETTANAMTWTFYLLSQNPEAAAKLEEEADRVLGDREITIDDVDKLPYARQVMAEGMRLYPPAWATSRTATEDVEIGGKTLPKDTLIFVSQWITQRDARWFDAPESFKPERWANDWQPPKGAYFPFGGGMRQCIGERFAWYEGIMILAGMARKWRFNLNEGHRVVPEAVVTLRPKYGMAMTAHKRLKTDNSHDNKREPAASPA